MSKLSENKEIPHFKNWGLLEGLRPILKNRIEELDPNHGDIDYTLNLAFLGFLYGCREAHRKLTDPKHVYDEAYLIGYLQPALNNMVPVINSRLSNGSAQLKTSETDARFAYLQQSGCFAVINKIFTRYQEMMTNKDKKTPDLKAAFDYAKQETEALTEKTAARIIMDNRLVLTGMLFARGMDKTVKASYDVLLELVPELKVSETLDQPSATPLHTKELAKT